MSSGFGSKVIGKEAFEREQREGQQSAGVFGPRVTGPVSGPLGGKVERIPPSTVEVPPLVPPTVPGPPLEAMPPAPGLSEAERAMEKGDLDVPGTLAEIGREGSDLQAIMGWEMGRNRGPRKTILAALGAEVERRAALVAGDGASTVPGQQPDVEG